MQDFNINVFDCGKGKKKNCKFPLFMPRRNRGTAIIILDLGFGFR